MFRLITLSPWFQRIDRTLASLCNWAKKRLSLTAYNVSNTSIDFGPISSSCTKQKNKTRRSRGRKFAMRIPQFHCEHATAHYWLLISRSVPLYFAVVIVFRYTPPKKRLLCCLLPIALNSNTNKNDFGMDGASRHIYTQNKWHGLFKNIFLQWNFTYRKVFFLKMTNERISLSLSLSFSSATYSDIIKLSERSLLQIEVQCFVLDLLRWF